MSQVAVSTAPFGETNKLPLELLEGANISYRLNPHGRKITTPELEALIEDCEVLIAGTERISAETMDRAKNLRLISRVGVGLDGVDMGAARERGIEVSYTPDAPAPAVAELTICLILSLLRSVHTCNLGMHRGEWQRLQGRRIPEISIGVIGVGRIGGRVLRRLSVFGSPRILANDIHPNTMAAPALKLEWVDKETLFKESDLITLHVPLTKHTHRLIDRKALSQMKPGVLIVNTARGGMVDEEALYEALKSGHVGGAAIDAFEEEPYQGNLATLDNCLLTSHMGSMSVDCRSRMEIEATEEAVRFLSGQPLKNQVPEEVRQFLEPAV